MRESFSLQKTTLKARGLKKYRLLSFQQPRDSYKIQAPVKLRWAKNWILTLTLSTEKFLASKFQRRKSTRRRFKAKFILKWWTAWVKWGRKEWARSWKSTLILVLLLQIRNNLRILFSRILVSARTAQKILVLVSILSNTSTKYFSSRKGMQAKEHLPRIVDSSLIVKLGKKLRINL